jgi:hypothetical protein
MHSIFVFILLLINYCSYASFAPDTQVHTPHGFASMRDLQLGQPIVSYNEQKQSPALGIVQNSHSYQTKCAYKVVCDDGTLFITTAGQRIMLYESLAWCAVEDLTIGDKLWFI